MKAVILAGGRGTRMGGLTERLPKPMVPLAGKPILEYQIELARKYGCREILLLTGYLSHVIEEHFGDGAAWGVSIRYHRENTPLGTAGALKAVETWLDQPFFVFYADVLMDVDLESLLAFHLERQASGTLVVHPNDHPYDSDLLDVATDGRITEFHAKPRPEGLALRNLVNAALYVLSPAVLSHIPPGQPLDLARDIFPRMIATGEVLSGYQTREYLRDVGTLERLHAVQDDVQTGKVARQNRSHPLPAIFLDRDGVLNAEGDHILSPEELHLLPGIPEAIRAINHSGFLAVVVTNQSAIAKGFLSEAELARIHAKLETLLGARHAYLDRIYYCPHHPERGFAGEKEEFKIDCECRKPAPGMVQLAARELNIDLTRSFLIGDRTTDIEAGKNAGVRTILVQTGIGGSDRRSACLPDYVAADLAAAVQIALTSQLPLTKAA